MNEREMLAKSRGTSSSLLSEGPANNEGIKPNVNDDQKYSFTKDPRLRSLAAQVGALIAIVFVSGKCVEYLVDKYVMDSSSVGVSDLQNGGEKNYKLGLLKGEEFSSAIGSVSIYKSENALVEELENLQKLTEQDLKLKTFWGRGKNYFIQVIGNKDE